MIEVHIFDYINELTRRNLLNLEIVNGNEVRIKAMKALVQIK